MVWRARVRSASCPPSFVLKSAKTILVDFTPLVLSTWVSKNRLNRAFSSNRAGQNAGCFVRSFPPERTKPSIGNTFDKLSKNQRCVAIRNALIFADSVANFDNEKLAGVSPIEFTEEPLFFARLCLSAPQRQTSHRFNAETRRSLRCRRHGLSQTRQDVRG